MTDPQTAPTMRVSENLVHDPLLAGALAKPTPAPLGYLICRRCGKRKPQFTYHCDVLIVCKECDCGCSGVL